MDWWLPLLTCIGSFSGFWALDSFLTRLNVQGVYYAVHSLHNAAIVAVTYPDVIKTFLDFEQVFVTENNWTSISLCYALHLYHTAKYWRKFRFDDWLHHILMIVVALPVGTIYSCGTLTAFSLFFTTGLPGGIDYLFLFGVRNGFVHPITEKRVNTFLNVWIRSPGCVTQAALSVLYANQMSKFGLSFGWPMIIPIVLNYWNGQYFMQQVVEDYTKRSQENSNRIV